MASEPDPAGPKPEDRPDPREGPNLEARHEAARRRAMADLVEASRGGGLFSIGRRLSHEERQEILAKGEAAAAWRKLYGDAPATRAGGLGRLGLLLAILAALFFGLLLLAG